MHFKMASVTDSRGNKTNMWFVICIEYDEDGEPKQYMCVRGDKEITEENRPNLVRYTTDNGLQCSAIEDEGTAANIEYSRWLRPRYFHPCYHNPIQFVSNGEEDLVDEFWREEIN